MSLRESELAHLLPELAARLVGQPLNNAWQPARDHVVLGFLDGTRLLLVPRGPDARLHTLKRRPKNPLKPYSFQGALRAHLSGPLSDLQQVAGERAVDLWFGAHRLHLRLTGKSGGLWLLEGDRVLAAYDGPAPAELPAFAEHGALALPARVDAEPTWDDAIGRFYAIRIRERRTHELRIVVGRALRREVQRLGRLLANLEDDLEKAGRADAVREQADTLAAHLHTVVRGSDHVELPSLDGTGTLTVPLLVDRAPSASLTHLYDRARRLERMGERVLERLDGTEKALARAEEQLGRVETMELEELEGLHRSTRGEEDTGGPRIPGVTTWSGPRGERVLVGRDAPANRRLTFQVGRGDDYWMHLRGKAGSHLLLPMQKGHTPSLEHLLAAAQIAAVHAGVPDGGRAEVQYTRIRDVRSIPGSADARVRVWNEKVLQVVRDPAELTGWSRD
ncbi:MAG: NFACT family protein [Alphaproteobacteria bacterium]|nr:NFACT family protein [Alphaproteobacteria bacterium]